jgi:hypothetical protein
MVPRRGYTVARFAARPFTTLKDAMGGQQNSEIVAGAPPARQVEDFSWIFAARAAIWDSVPRGGAAPS